MTIRGVTSTLLLAPYGLRTFARRAAAARDRHQLPPARTGSNWPLFIAKRGGYCQKCGLDVTLALRRLTLRASRDTGGGDARL